MFFGWQPVKRVEHIGEHGSKFCVFVYCLCSIMGGSCGKVDFLASHVTLAGRYWRVNLIAIPRRWFWREPLKKPSKLNLKRATYTGNMLPKNIDLSEFMTLILKQAGNRVEFHKPLIHSKPLDLAMILMGKPPSLPWKLPWSRRKHGNISRRCRELVDLEVAEVDQVGPTIGAQVGS